MALANIQITPQLVQAVRDSVDLIVLVEEHTRLKRAGRRYSGLCPLHREKTPSFSVDPEQGLFYCFGCGAGGDAIRFHQLVSGDDFPAAIEALARRFGIPLPAAQERRRGGQPEVEPVLSAAAEFFARKRRDSAVPGEYLRGRSIPEELAARFEIGYAPPGWRELLAELHPRFSHAELVAAGLVVPSERQPGEHYDRFRNRLMFPIRSPSGRLVGFGGRTLGDDRAKYVNTPETAEFHKGSLLYGLSLAKRALRESGRAILVEGYFDVLACAAAGIETPVASMGTALTREQARLLQRYCDEVVVAFDGDEAGEGAVRRALPILLAEGLTVRRARLGPGEDPDDVRTRRGPEELGRLLDEAPDGVELEIDRIAPAGERRDPPEQARIAREANELLAPIPDPVLRYGYGRMLAERLGVPVEMLLRAGRGRTEPPGARPRDEEQRERPREVATEEEAVIRALLQGLSTESSGAPERAAIPPPERLPSSEVFLDQACRNIFEAFRALYLEGNRPPARAVLLARLAGEGGAVDAAARFLVEEPQGLSAARLEESLARLQRRWQRRRRSQLQREIEQAHRSGDAAHLESLMRERAELVRELHGEHRETR